MAIMVFVRLGPSTAAMAMARMSDESAQPAPRLLLTRSEKQVLDLLLDGHTYQEIAAHLYVSVNTVKYHIKNIYRKAGCRSRSELIERLGPTRGRW
ncbi:MAG: helix-turn-helix transcriptional regulator [Bacillota bacterium]